MNDDLVAALDILKKGGIIIYPTDTIWGIGCDATNEQAVKKIYALKQRDDTKSMLVLVNSVNMIKDYMVEFPDVAYKLTGNAERPTTIIYPGARNLAKNLVNTDGTIGIRVTKDEFCNRLISEFKKPVVSTSANISDRPYPKTFSDIDPGILKQAGYVVKWRQNDKTESLPSGIIKIFENGRIEIIRE